MHEQVEEWIEEREHWSRRRREKIPPERRLLVLACMDERIPVDDALGIELGDAHVLRNAGGVVTDDVIRSAALSIHSSGTREIIVVNHTDCGMLGSPDATVEQLEALSGDGLEGVTLDPSLPALSLGDAGVGEWLRMADDIDEACRRQVEFLRDHPWIPDDVEIHGYVYEVESGYLRRPGGRIAEGISRRPDA